MSDAMAISDVAAARLGDMPLLRRYREARDERAFAEIVRRYAGMVYATTYRVLNNRQLAEDSVQETFLRLLRRPEGVSVSLGGWLHRVATQVAIDVSRSESARRCRERTRMREEPEPYGQTQEWSELSRALDESLAQLPEKSRDLLVEHYIMGRTQTRMAQEREISVPTISRRVAEALEELRGVLRRRGLGAGALMAVGEFMALRGSDALPAGLEEALGKLRLLAGVRRGWRMEVVRRRGLDFWQVRELQLAGMIGAGAAIAILILILLLHRPAGGGGSAPMPEAHAAARR